MARAGSFVAERILRPPTFVNSNYKTATVGGQDKRVTAKAGRRFVQNQDRWSRARVVTVPLVVPHDRSCAVQLIRCFTPPLDSPGRAFHDPN